MSEFADVKARIVAAWDKAAASPTDDLIELRTEDGLSVWRLGSSACIIESLRDDTPEHLRIRGRWRVLTNLTGTCPSCGATADISPDQRQAVRHLSKCPVPINPPTRYLVNPAISALLQAMG